jgi:predicted flap endonuclease-1-like 5' DNA nuclease
VEEIEEAEGADATVDTEDVEAEEVGAETAETEEDHAAAEADGEAETEDAETAAADDDGGGDPVHNIRGIGPAYADRLADMGIDTVAELAAAAPEDVAEGTNVSESRVTRWIERAAEYEA